MRKGTIIYIGGFELPDKNAAANRVMANAKILRKSGYSIVLIGIDKNITFDDDIKISKQEYEGFTCWGVPYPKNNKEWMKYLTSTDLFSKVVSKYNDIEAVICYNYQSVAFERIRRYCKKNKIKIISDCSEWYGGNEGNIFFKTLKYLDTTIRMKVINRKVDSLIVVSDYLAQYYNGKNTIVIPTLINSKLKNHSNYVKGYENNHIIKLIYAGVPFRLGKPLKNRKLAKDRLDLAILLLYKSFKKGIINFHFDIYGITKEQYLEVLPDDSQMLNELENQIIFHGRRSNSDVQKMVNQADFSLLIRDDNRTTKAGFPTKFTESITCGVPVIATNTSDLQKYLVEGKNGYFLDINKENIDLDKFIMILSLKQEQIEGMKEYCFNSDTFNIENWVDDVRLIL
ncbi:glycosyltransferase [Neobacillus sp. YX16]|uniref:glycosyltransferase n=1 Tax=Neobacillus sp. YX16 TaxID=3047874 RepID=UPI0024C43ABF|nr:glycosyltransferase [Neobacillus sp. YX16]WHZ02853.1 glycosyltransferase [Neobacillus sp. YX16]